MNNKWLILAVLAALFLVNTMALAVKAYPHPITVTQPDGTTITIRLEGDEYSKRKLTLDGYLLKKNSKGFLTYARKDAQGKIVASEHVVTNEVKRTTKTKNFLKGIQKADVLAPLQTVSANSRFRSVNVPIQKAFPRTGTPRTLVILVNFRDRIFSVSNPSQAFSNLLNQPGYNANGGTGSARDYFKASSYGKFSPQFDVVGPFDLPDSMKYYGANDSNGDDLRPEYMVGKACEAADAAGVNFSQYDADNNGVVDNVFIYYAGYNEAENGPDNSVWPHRWSLASSGYSGQRTFDGKLVSSYACTSELRGSSGTNMCGIGTFCHEFGHVIGLPDYYHTTSGSKYTLEKWSIMDIGSYNNSGRTPPVYSAYDRFFLGYSQPQAIAATNSHVLLPLSQDTAYTAITPNQSYLLSANTHNLNGSNPSPNEFFVVEYRKKTGWDTFLPAEGMLIWHIDYSSSAWNSNSPNNYSGAEQTADSHMRVYLQPLVGSTTTPGTAFTSGSFTPILWNGTDINRSITNINKMSAQVNFDITVNLPTININDTVTTFSSSLGNASFAQSVVLTGNTLGSAVQVGLSNSTHFDVKLSASQNWGKSVSISPVNQSINDSLMIRYSPTSWGSHSTQLIIQSTGAETRYLTLNGIAINPNPPSIVVGNPAEAISFDATLLNTVSEKNLTVRTTDAVSNLTVSVSGPNASMFTVSVVTMDKGQTNSFSGFGLKLSYQPSSAGQHTATLIISGGGLLQPKIIQLTGEGMN